MLTQEALREQKWGSFPALRQILEDKLSSGRYDGITSVSDNIFQRLQRLADVACTAEESREELLQAVRARPDLRAQLEEDLCRLQEDLEGTLGVFSREINAVRSLWKEMRTLN